MKDSWIKNNNSHNFCNWALASEKLSVKTYLRRWFSDKNVRPVRPSTTLILQQASFHRVLGFLHFWLFVMCGEREWNKRMLPQPVLEPGTSMTGLSFLSWTKMNSVLMLALCYGGYHTGLVILRQKIGPGFRPTLCLKFFTLQKATTQNLHENWLVESFSFLVPMWGSANSAISLRVTNPAVRGFSWREMGNLGGRVLAGYISDKSQLTCYLMNWKSVEQLDNWTQSNWTSTYGICSQQWGFQFQK